MIKQFSLSLCMAAIVGLVALSSESTYAATATAADITDSSASFSATGITLNPFTGGAASLMGSNGGCCFGVLGGGNTNSVDDVDGDPSTTGDQERMDFVLDPGYVMLGIDFQWTRANPIEISGFLSDPQISFDTGGIANISTVYNAGTNTVSILHPWQGGTITEFTFNNPLATQGQTLSLIAADLGNPGAQATLNQIEWDLASALPVDGDVDGDGDVDLVEIGGDGISDFDIIRDNWFNSASPTREMGDLTGDGIVEFDDFAEWKAAFPFPIAGSFATGFYVVPEPTSFALLSIACLGLIARKRRTA